MTIDNWVTTSGSWNTAADWNPSGIPGTTDTVLFDTGSATPYVVAAGTQSADIVNGVSIVGDDVTLSGTVLASPGVDIDTGTLTVNGELEAGTLGIDNSTVVDSGKLTLRLFGNQSTLPQVYANGGTVDETGQNVDLTIDLSPLERGPNPAGHDRRQRAGPVRRNLPAWLPHRRR